MRQHASYSAQHQAWTVSGLEAQIIFLEHVDLLPTGFSSVQDVLEEGARRGIWDMDLDAEMAMDVVMLR
jgi:hypothetical protein